LTAVRVGTEHGRAALAQLLGTACRELAFTAADGPAAARTAGDSTVATIIAALEARAPQRRRRAAH
jgi:hypothetical protein